MADDIQALIGRCFSGQSITRLARKHMAGNTGAYFAPNIPERKRAGAAAKNAVAAADVLVIHDDTLLGSAEDGFVLTLWGVHWNNYLEWPQAVAWADVDVEQVRASKRGFALGAGEVCMSSPDKVGPGAAAVVRAVAWLAQQGHTVGVIDLEAAPVPDGMERCPYCRVKNAIQSIYCQSCGAPV